MRASSELVTPDRRLRSATSPSDLPRYKRFSASKRFEGARRAWLLRFLLPNTRSPSLAASLPRIHAPAPTLLRRARATRSVRPHHQPSLLSAPLPNRRTISTVLRSSSCSPNAREPAPSARLKPSASFLRSAHARHPRAHNFPAQRRQLLPFQRALLHPCTAGPTPMPASNRSTSHPHSA
jgi:hypothetical protein